jgi:hypothetical protein
MRARGVDPHVSARAVVAMVSAVVALMPTGCGNTQGSPGPVSEDGGYAYVHRFVALPGMPACCAGTYVCQVRSRLVPMS